MLFTSNVVTNEDLKTVNNIFDELDSVKTVTPEEAQRATTISKYFTSVATSAYAKSVEEIANTNTSNKVVRRKNLQQVIQQSFFYGANRFGNNFIA